MVTFELKETRNEPYRYLGEMMLHAKETADAETIGGGNMSGLFKKEQEARVVREQGSGAGKAGICRSFEARSLDPPLREMGCLLGHLSKSDVI